MVKSPVNPMSAKPLLKRLALQNDAMDCAKFSWGKRSKTWPHFGNTCTTTPIALAGVERRYTRSVVSISRFGIYWVKPRTAVFVNCWAAENVSLFGRMQACSSEKPPKTPRNWREKVSNKA